MANTPVTLDVKNFSNTTPGYETYTNTVSNTGATYCYKYAGGTGGGAVTEFTGDGGSTITVTVTANFTFQVYNVTFAGDDAGNLSWSWGNVPQNNQAIISDSDVTNENAYYSVIVSDRSKVNCTIPCDPPITNKPKPD